MAIKKYGKNNFEKKILFYCETEKELNKMEIFFIKKYETYLKGYNLTLGGDGVLGKEVSTKTKEKISKKAKQRYIENPNLRNEISNRAKLYIGAKNPFYGKKLTNEHIDKMTKARVLAISGGNNPSSVKVKCIDLGMVFETAKDAAIFCKLSYSTTILKAAKGQRKTAGGYRWELVN